MARRPRRKPINQLTIPQFETMFPDEDACRAYLVARRWPHGVHCPVVVRPSQPRFLIVLGIGSVISAPRRAVIGSLI